jgi:hypothetical protein
MQFLEALVGGAAVLSIIWMVIVAFYLILPILIWIDTRAIRKATEASLVEQKTQNTLTRQLLRAYGHEPSA